MLSVCFEYLNIMDQNLFTLFTTLNSEERALKFLQEKNIIPRIKKCKKKHLMKVQFTKKNTRWVCSKQTCREERGLRNDNGWKGQNYH